MAEPLSSSEFRKNFFSSKAVLEKVPPAVRKALSKVGAYVRTRAKSSLRYETKSRKVSRPGEKPVVHRSQTFVRTNRRTGKPRFLSPLKELIYFAYDASINGVVVGPAIGGPKDHSPGVLEHGGTTQVEVLAPAPVTYRKATPKQAAAYQGLVKSGRIVPKPRPKRQRQTKAVTIAPRPYMFPALEAETAGGRGAVYLKGLIR